MTKQNVEKKIMFAQHSFLWFHKNHIELDENVNEVVSLPKVVSKKVMAQRWFAQQYEDRVFTFLLLNLRVNVSNFIENFP